MPRTSKLIEYLRFVLSTKGFIGFILRIGMLIGRFDLLGNKMKKAIREIEQAGKKYKYKPTIIIPAIILKRHHKFLSHLSNESLEMAIHGYTHINFEPLSLKEQVAQIMKAKDVFKEFKLTPNGFRAPYLSWNDKTTEAVQKTNLLWQSNETFIWNDFVSSQLSRWRHFMANAIHLLYNPLDAQNNVVIPRLQGELVSIPITLPDDEILIDRLGIKDSNRIEDIWTEILERAYRRGDIFVLQLHPERFQICKKSMEDLLNKATNSKHGTWIVSMREIAEWWKEKSQFRFTFEKVLQKGYQIHCKCADRATVLSRNLDTETSQAPFYQDYHSIEARDFFVESGNLKPCIGVHPKCSKMLLYFLRDEGFPYEVSDSNKEYSIFLDEYEAFNTKDERGLLSRIEENSNPLVRYWRWPDGMRSAFVTTHDLDCLALTDFLLRIFGK